MRYLISQVEGLDRAQMRTLADALRNKLKSAVIVLASTEDGAVSIVATVTKDLTAKVTGGQAGGNIVAQSLLAAKAVGGPIWRKAAGKIRLRCLVRWPDIEAEVDGKL